MTHTSTMSITVIERTVYYVDHFEYETQFECDHDEEGWYVELSYSDGGFDVLSLIHI